MCTSSLWFEEYIHWVGILAALVLHQYCFRALDCGSSKSYATSLNELSPVERGDQSHCFGSFFNRLMKELVSILHRVVGCSCLFIFACYSPSFTKNTRDHLHVYAQWERMPNWDASTNEKTHKVQNWHNPKFLLLGKKKKFLYFLLNWRKEKISFIFLFKRACV